MLLPPGRVVTAPQEPRYGSCQWCGLPLPDVRRAHRRYCKVAHRVRAAEARRRVQRTATAVESVTPGTLTDSPGLAA